MTPPVPNGRGCLDAETLAAWHDGMLSAADVEAVDSHLADCDRCQALLAAFVRTDVAQAVPVTPATESAWRRWRLAWLVPVATAATVAAVWVALPDRSAITRPPASESDVAAGAERQRLAEARDDRASAGQPAAADLQAKAEASEELLAQAPAATPPVAASEAFAPAQPAVPAEARAAERPPARALLSDRADRAVPAAESASVAQFRAEAPAVEVVSPDPAVRWRVAGGRVERTTTAGSGWQLTAGVEDTIAAGSAPTASVCWLVGPEGVVYLTTDGATFERLPFPEVVNLTAVTATDGRTAIVTAADGRTWRTADAGRTWR